MAGGGGCTGKGAAGCTAAWAGGAGSLAGFDNDYAFAVVGPGGKTGQSNQLDLTVGSNPVLFDQPHPAQVYSFGYPHASPYDGQKLVYCAGKDIADTWGGTSDYGLSCTMTGGSSGGPWLVGFNASNGVGSLTSVNSFKYTAGKFTKYMWGPYFGALLGDHWLLEAGISASGAFVDHVVRSHPAREELGDAPFAALDSLLRELASSSGDAMALTRDRHLQPNVLGNRAPLADPSIAGGIAGWRLRDDLDDLAAPAGADADGFGAPSLLLGLACDKAKASGREKVMTLWRNGRASDGDRAAYAAMIGEMGVSDRAHALLEAYKEQAIRSLPPLQNASLKGLLRRVVGKVFRVEIKGWCSEFEARDAAGRQAGAQAAR